MPVLNLTPASILMHSPWPCALESCELLRQSLHCLSGSKLPCQSEKTPILNRWFAGGGWTALSWLTLPRRFYQSGIVLRGALIARKAINQAELLVNSISQSVSVQLMSAIIKKQSINQDSKEQALSISFYWVYSVPRKKTLRSDFISLDSISVFQVKARCGSSLNHSAPRKETGGATSALNTSFNSM